MWVGLDRFSRVLVVASLATTILLSLVVVIMLLCRQPSRRIVLAQAAVALAVLMIPIVSVDLLPRFDARSWFSNPVTGLSSPSMLRGEELPRSARLMALPADQGQARTSDPSERGSWWTGPWPLRVLTLTYLAGVTIGLAWFLLGFWGVGRLIQGSVEPAAATSEFYLEQFREFRGASPAPRLRVSPHVTRPVVAGLVRPTIMIPKEFDGPGFDRDLLKVILIHELAHADQGDSKFSAAASLAQSLWFFLPFPWWLREQLRMDQEFVADQRTVQMAGSSAGYATRLVCLAAPTERSSGFRPASGSDTMLGRGWWNGGSKSPLLQRVVMLLQCPFPIELQPPRWWCLSARLLIVGLAVFSASTSLSLLPPLAAASNGPTRTPPPARFQVSHFVATSQVVSRSGRSLPLVFPLLLPDRFELKVEIQASRSALSQIRLASLQLDSSRAAGAGRHQEKARTDADSDWHPVRVARDGDRVALEVDGQNIPVRPSTGLLTEWLMIEPAPAQTATLRNLVVTW